MPCAKYVLVVVTVLALVIAGGASAFVVSHTGRNVVQPQPRPGSCHVRGQYPFGMPDPHCTPGALNPVVTQATIHKTICRRGYPSSISPPARVTRREKLASIRAYGFRLRPSRYEYDNLIPLNLGGAANDRRNLWPEQGASPNLKDQVEGYLHTRVCDGRMSLARAQRIIALDWVSFYSQNVKPKPKPPSPPSRPGPTPPPSPPSRPGPIPPPSPPSPPAPPSPPVNQAAPRIIGGPVIGATLIEANGQWTNSPTSFSYQWQRCDSAGSSCIAIPGATGQSYTPTLPDVGDAIRVQEWATNAAGTAGPANSPVTALVTTPPQPPPGALVCPSGCPYSDIQPAIDAAQTGEQITIAAGTYGPINTDDKSITLLGAGAGATTINAVGANVSVVYVGSGTVTITGVTITGSTGAASPYGGGITNYGTLALEDSTITNNTSWGGSGYGGIANYGKVRLQDSTISDNKGRDAGGIGNFGSMMLNDSTISGNSSWRANGGIANSGQITLNHCAVTANLASMNGGGIGNGGTGGTITLKASIVAGNAALYGGGIQNGGTMTLSNSTVAGNTAYVYGGGIDNSGYLTLTGSSRIDTNTANGGTNSGGGIYNTNKVNGAVAGVNVYNNTPDDIYP